MTLLKRVPYGAVITFGFTDKLPRALHVAVTLMAHLNSALNPLFYILFNPSFSKSFFNRTRRILYKNVPTSSYDVNENSSRFDHKGCQTTRDI